MTDAQRIYEEIKKRMGNPNLYTREDFLALVDEVVADFIDQGEITQEDDTEDLRENLEFLWEQDKLS